MAIITFLAANLVPKFIPERFKQVAVWIGLAVAAIALLWAAKAIYDASVVANHEKERAIGSIDARDDAADQRAKDTIRDMLAEREREEAISGADNTGATLAPSTVAANCKRLERAYTAAELEKVQAYRDLC